MKTTIGWNVCEQCGRKKIDPMSLNSSGLNRAKCYKAATGSDSLCSRKRSFLWVKPSPLWEPGYYKRRSGLGISRLGNNWALLQFPKSEGVNVWECESWAGALELAKRCEGGHRIGAPDMVLP